MAIPLGRPSPSASCDRPERRREGPPGTPDRSGSPAAPTWSCSRWGFPCRRRCRRRGALLPHRFTLAAHPACRGGAGGVLSVALSLGSPPPGVTRHRTSVEPGLSSLRPKAESGHPAVWHWKIWEFASGLPSQKGTTQRPHGILWAVPTQLRRPDGIVPREHASIIAANPSRGP